MNPSFEQYVGIDSCALADFTLRKAGPAGRRDLKRRLAQAGWDF